MINRENIEWKWLPGLEGKIEISNYGDVRCMGYYDKCNRFKKPYERKFEECTIANSGYYLSPTKGGIKEAFLHRLVAITFLGCPAEKKEVNHLDGNKLNNFVGTAANRYTDGNLEWVTRKRNMEHASKMGLIDRDSELRKIKSKFNIQKAIDESKKPILQLDFKGNVIAEFESVKAASMAMCGKKDSCIASVASQARGAKYRKSAFGFQWVYKEDYNPTYDYTYRIQQFECMKKAVDQFTLDGVFVATYFSIKEAAKAVGSYDGTYIGECCAGKRRMHKGFLWKYHSPL